jgi:hypothetical protein
MIKPCQAQHEAHGDVASKDGPADLTDRYRQAAEVRTYGRRDVRLEYFCSVWGQPQHD